MATYVCFNCRTPIDITDANQKITCPKCSGKIFFKVPEEERRKVKAI